MSECARIAAKGGKTLFDGARAGRISLVRPERDTFPVVATGDAITARATGKGASGVDRRFRAPEQSWFAPLAGSTAPARSSGSAPVAIRMGVAITIASADNLLAQDMTLRSDLSRLIRGQFDKKGISYNPSIPLDRLAARYFEMNVRRIRPVPRRVHFSDRTHASLGKLMRHGKEDPAALDAWFTVFRLHRLLVEGTDVTPYLSKNIRKATRRDGLLWHYGMHHFHLRSEMDTDGFVKRSDHILFAIVAPEDAYLVDVGPHPPEGGIEWSNQELLRTVHASWPELIEANVLHGVHGTELTDAEVHALRRTNMNSVSVIDGKAVAPLGGGMAGDGSSVSCTFRASGLLRVLRDHEEVLREEGVRRAVAQNLRAQGFDAGSTLEFGLVFLEDLHPPPDLLAALAAETCFSRDLYGMGFAIVEKGTGSHIVLQVAPRDLSREAR